MNIDLKYLSLATFVILLGMIYFVESSLEEKKEGSVAFLNFMGRYNQHRQPKTNNQLHHHWVQHKHQQAYRVRRMLGSKIVCFPEIKKFCRFFSYGETTKQYCLFVKVQRCTALD